MVQQGQVRQCIQTGFPGCLPVLWAVVGWCHPHYHDEILGSSRPQSRCGPGGPTAAVARPCRWNAAEYGPRVTAEVFPGTLLPPEVHGAPPSEGSGGIEWPATHPCSQQLGGPQARLGPGLGSGPAAIAQPDPSGSDPGPRPCPPLWPPRTVTGFPGTSPPPGPASGKPRLAFRPW